jgi:cytochrome c oxidase cbb3-type subunit 3
MPMLEQHEHKHPVHNFDGIIENRVQSPPPYFTVLFYGLILWGVLFSAWFLLSGWSSEEEFRQNMAVHREQAAAREPDPAKTGVPAAAATGEEEVSGQELFASHCAACHGAEGKGGIGPDLTASDYAYGSSPEAVRASIAEGRPGGMPGFGNQLSGAEIEALAEFVGSLRR